MKEKNKGITLIALIITIIVLIILAAIVILTLTGDHSVIKNAQVSRCSAAYREAEEKTNLAHTGIRGEIEVKRTTDSTYDARKPENARELLKKVQRDLKDKEYTFYLDEENAVIYILYTDTAIKKDLLGGNRPLSNKYVFSKITLYEQKATYEFDIGPEDAIKEAMLGASVGEFGGGSGGAGSGTIKLKAEQFSFTSEDAEWNVKDVQEALDYFYKGS